MLQNQIGKAERDRVRQEIAALTARHTDTFRQLHRAASAFFAEEAAGETYARRPNLSIKLAADGIPPARLAICPGWDRRSRTLFPA
jgi:hypothetical protein